jgi:hypothetical protein
MGALADLLAFNRNKDYQAEQAQQVGGLLDQYRVAGDPNAQNPGPWGIGQPEMQQAMFQQQGGYRQPTGLLGAMPPSEFYLKAATVPGLTQPMLTQAQAQQGAMDRQVQDQTFRQSNMTAAELANHTLQQTRMEWDQDWSKYQFNNVSAAQRGSLGIQGAHLGIAQQNADLQRQQFDAQFPVNPLTGVREQAKAPTPLSFANQTEVKTAYSNTQNALNTLNDYERIIASGQAPSLFLPNSARAQQYQANFESSMVPIVTKMFKPTGDAPSESELKQIKAYVGDLMAIGTDKGKLEKLRQLKTDVERYWQPYNQFGAAPAAQAGQSAFARSYPGSVIPRPEGLTPFEPPKGP